MKDAAMDVALAKPDTPVLHHSVCSFQQPRRDQWQAAYIDLPAEPLNNTNVVLFSIVLKVSGDSFVHLDNITLYSAMCEDVIPVGER
jgi:hypothetical protein